MIKNLLGGDEVLKRSRKPEIMSDAAYIILTKDSKESTGQFYLVNIFVFRMRSCLVQMGRKTLININLCLNDIRNDFLESFVIDIINLDYFLYLCNITLGFQYNRHWKCEIGV